MTTDRVADFLTWGMRGARWVDLADADLADSINWVLEEGGPETKIHLVTFSRYRKPGDLIRLGKNLGGAGLIEHVMCVSSQPITAEEAEEMYEAHLVDARAAG